ncbi:hypothetical protein PAHAL_3G404600 [Panicum hallii]|uniref:Uncharacterized protein n=1 Tax=Panicum hallii TaxID=206008 RepID=A0A2T8KKY6_9POAL|nr:hypothetical protein PAHAL_3G404600 [Panicum hallii]
MGGSAPAYSGGQGPGLLGLRRRAEVPVGAALERWRRGARWRGRVWGCRGAGGGIYRRPRWGERWRPVGRAGERRGVPSMALGRLRLSRSGARAAGGRDSSASSGDGAALCGQGDDARDGVRQRAASGGAADDGRRARVRGRRGELRVRGEVVATSGAARGAGHAGRARARGAAGAARARRPRPAHGRAVVGSRGETGRKGEGRKGREGKKKERKRKERKRGKKK